MPTSKVGESNLPADFAPVSPWAILNALPPSYLGSFFLFTFQPFSAQENDASLGCAGYLEVSHQTAARGKVERPQDLGTRNTCVNVEMFVWLDPWLEKPWGQRS